MTLEELFEEHRDSLFRFLARMTDDPDFAEDIVQETFLTLARRDPVPDGPTRAWIFQLARNLARSGMRKRSRRLRLLQRALHRVPRAAPSPTPDVEAERAEARRALRKALERLSERERTIVLMREEGFTHREIAEAVGTTTGSIGTMFARAMAKLEDRLPDGLEEEP